jgi:hypothetical protein
MLLQENEELGKVITSGRTAKLEGEIAVQKQLVQEMKGNQAGTVAQGQSPKIVQDQGVETSIRLGVVCGTKLRNV